MNSRSFVLLLAFLVLFLSGTAVTTAANPKSDDPLIQKIFDKWAERDAATKNILIEFEMQQLLAKGAYDKLLPPEDQRPEGFPKGPIPPKDINTVSKISIICDSKAIAVDMNAQHWDVMGNKLQKMKTKVSLKDGKMRSLTKAPSIELYIGTVTKLDKTNYQDAIFSEKNSYQILYWPIRFFEYNCQLDKAKIVGRDIEIDGRKCVKLEIPMKAKAAKTAKDGKDKTAAKAKVESKCFVWVDQSKDYLPMRYEDYKGKDSLGLIDFGYNFSKGTGWELVKSNSSMSSNNKNPVNGKINKLELNGKIDPAVYKIEFPVGTLVRAVDKDGKPLSSDVKDKNKIDKNKVDPNNYFVLENGKKSTIAETEKRMQKIHSEVRTEMKEEAKREKLLPWRIVGITLGSIFIAIAGVIFFVKRRAKG
jgi:hypothetical protein